MNLPDHEPQLIPMGRFDFELTEEPEKRKRQGKGKEFVVVTFTFKVTGSEIGSRKHTESFLPWSDEYGQLLEAFGGERDSSGRVHLDEATALVGIAVTADIEHHADKDDPSKTWARMTNIGDTEGKKIETPEDDEVPF